MLAMTALRRAPVPWPLKYRAIWLTQPKAVLAVVAIIPDTEGRILALRARYSGFWVLPGGALNAGEDPRAGVLRECREELGEEVVIERLTGVYLTHGANMLFTHGARVLFAYRCAPLAGQPHLSEEHDAFQYMPTNTAPMRLRLLASDAPARWDEAPVTYLGRAR